MPLPTGSGGLIVVGVADESTQGTYVGPTTYLGVYASDVSYNFDPKLIPIRVSARNIIRTRKRVKTLAEPKCALGGPLSVDFLSFIAKWGVTSAGMIVPTPQSVTVGYDAVSKIELAGMLCTLMEIYYEPNRESYWKCAFEGITDPVLVETPLAAPSFTLGEVFDWSDMDPADLIGASARLDLQSAIARYMFKYSKAPGNNKSNSYAFMKLDEVAASGSVTVLHRNAAEFNAMKAATPGAIHFGATKGGNSIAHAFPIVKYNTDDIQNRDGQFITEPLPFEAEDPAAAVLATITVA